MRTLAALVWLLASTEVAGPEVEMKVVTADGYVAFRVDGSWPVVASDSKPPVSVLAFQIPNAADDGTPDSTNVAVSVFQLDSETGRTGLAAVPTRVGAAEPKRERFEGWEVFRQEGRQGPTAYSIVDAKRTLAQAGVAVRVAWPHLSRNPPDYDARMEATLRALLRSVREHVGPWQPQEGEVIHRPPE